MFSCYRCAGRNNKAPDLFVSISEEIRIFAISNTLNPLTHSAQNLSNLNSMLGLCRYYG